LAFIGLDLHKKFIEGAVIKSPSKIADRTFTLTADRDSIKTFARSLSRRDSVCLENTGSAFKVATLIRLDTKARIIVSNPMTTRMITHSKKKTDKIDSLCLANLLASDYLPTVWQPDASTIVFRRLVAYYHSISTQKTASKNRIHAILQRNLVGYAFNDLFTSRGREFLSSVSLPQDELEQVSEELTLIDALNDRLTAIKQRLAKLAINDSTVKRIMTITGINMLTAITLRSAIGDQISRFSSPKKLVSYLGLGCSISQSADRCYVGRITKRGNVFARSALVQSAQVCVKFPSPLRAFFQRLYQKKGRNKSIIAVASKLTRIIWHMLTNEEDYRYENKALTRIKILKLNSLAGVVSKRAKRITDVGCGKKAEREYRARVRKCGKR
jgi:transposase